MSWLFCKARKGTLPAEPVGVEPQSVLLTLLSSSNYRLGELSLISADGHTTTRAQVVLSQVNLRQSIAEKFDFSIYDDVTLSHPIITRKKIPAGLCFENPGVNAVALFDITQGDLRWFTRAGALCFTTDSQSYAALVEAGRTTGLNIHLMRI